MHQHPGESGEDASEKKSQQKWTERTTHENIAPPGTAASQAERLVDAAVIWLTIAVVTRKIPA